MKRDENEITSEEAARTRSKAGPSSATPNERGANRNDGHGAETDRRALPKISKRKAGRGDSYGGGLH